MEARELRIGNWISNRGHEFQILEISPVDDGAYKPIPLDEGWLERFGYENWGVVEVNEYESYKRYVLHNFLDTSNHEVHIIHSTYGGVHYTEYVTSIDMDERQYNWRLEFVHDLQNAVYKETGKELKIKQHYGTI